MRKLLQLKTILIALVREGVALEFGEHAATS